MNKLLLIVILYAIKCNNCQEKLNLFVGDACVTKTYEGTCKKIEDCDVVLKQIYVWGSHNYTQCNFDKRDEVTCCPNTSNMTTMTATAASTSTTKKPVLGTEFREPDIARKSDQNCDNYSQRVKQGLRSQIIGGKNASEGEFPHMAALAHRDVVSGEIVWYCGGSLISDNYVLTAAHCIVNRQQRKPIFVRLGKLNLLTNDDNLEAQDMYVESTIVHEKYNVRSKINDIGLIKLNKSIVSTAFVHPACLYTQNNDPIGLIVTGWGSTLQTSFKPSLTALQKATVEPVNLSSCNETLSKAIQSNVFSSQICAKSANSIQDACQADSGGPLQVLDRIRGNIRTIVGVTSTGIGCGGDIPGIYTRVFGYLDWIENKVWP